jgi:hypothetical protein
MQHDTRDVVLVILLYQSAETVLSSVKETVHTYTHTHTHTHTLQYLLILACRQWIVLANFQN